VTQTIFGIHPVNEALKSPSLLFEKIFLGTRTPHPSLQSILDLAAEKNVPVTVVPEKILDQMARGGLHQNVVAIVKGTPYADIEGILSRWRTQETKAIFLILDGIQDPQNFGALVRTALGCGVHGMIIPKDRAVGITPAVVKTSAGATAHLPIARVVNIANTVDALKKEGLWVYGAAGEASELIYDIDLNIDLAIVIGAEGKGIRPLVKKKCDRLFSIPMKGPVSSFNASVSAGMILYEVMRQRSTAGRGRSS
jgi:23S rRNA (guanosine2251-2'-O)-methyltransferase